MSYIAVCGFICEFHSLRSLLSCLWTESIYSAVHSSNSVQYMIHVYFSTNDLLTGQVPLDMSDQTLMKVLEVRVECFFALSPHLLPALAVFYYRAESFRIYTLRPFPPYLVTSHFFHICFIIGVWQDFQIFPAGGSQHHIAHSFCPGHLFASHLCGPMCHRVEQLCRRCRRVRGLCGQGIA